MFSTTLCLCGAKRGIFTRAGELALVDITTKAGNLRRRTASCCSTEGCCESCGVP